MVSLKTLDKNIKVTNPVDMTLKIVQSSVFKFLEYKYATLCTSVGKVLSLRTLFWEVPMAVRKIQTRQNINLKWHFIVS